ncbi:MAG TPA: pyridoxal-phosphate dependent enzyme [Humisphaera sp.]|jgi:cysteine synthase A|nr:pyridoxal-phosphate dependent enzyme [Humisphaera sp.]
MGAELSAKHEALLECPCLVELSEKLNPFKQDRVRIYAQSCGDNIKKFAALNLLLEAQADGRLKGVHTLVENSSGNMALALGILAPAFGIKNIIAILRADIPSGKLDPLRLSRIKCHFSTESADEPGGIELARQMGARPGHINLAQYENDSNPRAYEKWLAPRIWKQTDGKLTIACAGLGTTGTAMGMSRYFKRVSQNCVVVGAMCAPGAAVPGLRGEDRLREIKFPWRQTLDAIEQVGTKESFVKSRELWWDIEMMVGPSSGSALAGLLNFIAARKEAGTLDQHRNSNGEVCAAFVCPDTAYPYFDKYSTHLDPQDLV